MTHREKLIELLENAPATPNGERNVATLADHLLANGIIVPPCKVGDTLYSIVEGINQIFVGEVYEGFFGRYGIAFRSTRKGYFTLFFTEEDIGKTVFLSRDEAEKAVKEFSEVDGNDQKTV